MGQGGGAATAFVDAPWPIMSALGMSTVVSSGLRASATAVGARAGMPIGQSHAHALVDSTPAAAQRVGRMLLVPT